MSDWTEGKWEIITNNGAVCIEGGNPREFVLDVLDSNPQLPRKKHLANARRIVHCVNNFDELVKALEEYIDWFDKISRYQHQRLGHGLKEACHNWEEASDVEMFDCSKMRKALQKAKSAEK